jgi:hypothetical protein
MVPTKADFTRKEWRIIESHRTPEQVQRYLSALPYNWERGGKTCRSFRGVVRFGCAHCLEAAITAAVILEQHGAPPLLVSFESQDKLDHVLFLFKRGDFYGAVARSRDLGLHGRKPVFRTVRSLVMSYFDPYIDQTGRITGYAVADLRELGNYDWRLSDRNVWKVERYLQEIPHREIRASDARYQKWKRRYLRFCEQNPGSSPDYFPNRHLWML